MKEYYSYKFQVRTNEAITPRLGGHLYQQYVVDAFSTIEQARLWWFRTNQSTLRTELYTNIQQSLSEGTSDTSNLGKGFILPAGFVGSRRYMQQNFQDALVVCRYIGHPDIFLTMTINPVWDEVIQMMKLLPHCCPQNSPDVMARVFILKLDQLIDDIKKKHYFGTCLGVMYVVEFQKRGLPHVHMLIWLDSASKHISPKSIVRQPLLISPVFQYINDDKLTSLLAKKKTGNPHLILNEKQQQYYALAEIHTLLKSIGKSLKDYSQMPQPPNSYLDCSVNNLIIEETSYDIGEMEKEYSTLISSYIGDGKIPAHRNSRKDNSEDDISIPPMFCNLDSGNSVEKMIESTFPNLKENFQKQDYLSERAILTPTNQTVGNVNSIIVDSIPGEISSYFSIDTAEDYPGTERDQLASFPPEYLNSISIPDVGQKFGSVRECCIL
ncbi:hypothetical protein POM88_046002 [Heracleum sosnowskyi]|uniref:Helitron helicase-like domain-containing protein n=1 Tax=Heracleum sosnowskyi TaxID=360622 RepID=A0AAD8H8B8_9APIA|nr:hypothetical protein POM88_046002 [Heracleum sosnowskyi]